MELDERRKRINAGLDALEPFRKAGMMDEGIEKEIADRLVEMVSKTEEGGEDEDPS